MFYENQVPFLFSSPSMLHHYDNLIKVLSTPLKAKLTMDESLYFKLWWGIFVYNVEKSYVPIDVAPFFIYVI